MQALRRDTCPQCLLPGIGTIVLLFFIVLLNAHQGSLSLGFHSVVLGVKKQLYIKTFVIVGGNTVLLIT